MRNFSKTVVLSAVLLGLWACPLSGYWCEDDSICPDGSFCFKTDDKGLCSWGEWAEDEESGAWAILPKIVLSDFGSHKEIEVDIENPRLRRVETLATNVDPLKLTIFILGYAAFVIPEPLVDDGVSVYCTREYSGRPSELLSRTCSFEASRSGEYIVYISAENNNGRNSVRLSWAAATPP